MNATPYGPTTAPKSAEDWQRRFFTDSPLDAPFTPPPLDTMTGEVRARVEADLRSIATSSPLSAADFWAAMNGRREET